MTAMPRPDYPLRLTPIYKEKVWGGRALERLGRELPGTSQTLIGESWELVDMATTSASGGGGNAERSVIADGPLAGRTLAEVIGAHGTALLGHLPLSEQGGFPILLKYLDASENLSVQVHPSPAYAASHPDAFLKSEAWYIVDAAPGSVIYKGIKPGVTPGELRDALAMNTDTAVVPLMIEVPVQPGDCHYLPSGTCHALGGGILVAEVQTPSDTTFRVYDWGRVGRELHVEPALDCITFGPADVAAFERKTVLSSTPARVTRLVACEFFRIDRVAAPGGFEDVAGLAEPSCWMVLQGRVTLSCQAGHAVTLDAGDTALLPAAMRGGRVSVDAEATWLQVTFPNAERSRLA